MKNSVELEAAEALLDVGISLPLFRIRMPWGKGWTWRVVMRRPCLGSQMRIARQFLKLGITSQQVERFTDDQERAFFVEHLRELSMMVAFAVCRSYLSGLILAPGRSLADPMESASRISGRGATLVQEAAQHPGFYRYYRLGRNNQSVSARREPKKSDKRELRAVQEGSHSPFGIIWQIASATGWSVHYILWRVNFQTLTLMLADAPHYELSDDKQAGGMTTEQIFQSKLKL